MEFMCYASVINPFKGCTFSLSGHAVLDQRFQEDLNNGSRRGQLYPYSFEREWAAWSQNPCTFMYKLTSHSCGIEGIGILLVLILRIIFVLHSIIVVLYL